MTVLLLEILAAARAHVAPLAAESAGYLLLAAADQVALAPRVIDSGDVELSADGTVRLRARRDRAPVSATASPELALRELLARSLEVASSVGPALRRAAERRQEAGLDALVREFETALIPVNRAAAKRALSRLYRETERARDAGKLTALLQAADLETPAPSAEAVVLAADFPQGESVTPAPRLPEVVDAPAPVKAVIAPERASPAPIAPSPLVAREASPLVAREASPRVSAQVAAAPMFLTPPPLPTEDGATLTRGPDQELAATKPEPVVERARERGSATPRLGTVVTAQTLPDEDVGLTERAPAVEFAVDADELDVPIEIVLDPERSSCNPERSQASPAPQPLVDPEPSSLPDVLSAMRALHLDVAAIEAEEAPTRIRDVVTEPRGPSVQQPATWNLLVPELADPSVHDALTWNPGPVELAAPLPPAALLIVEAAPEPSPYAPAVLPTRISDVSELLDTFYVSGGSEERELRGALKEMAGLELTPMPHPLGLGKQG